MNLAVKQKPLGRWRKMIWCNFSWCIFLKRPAFYYHASAIYWLQRAFSFYPYRYGTNKNSAWPHCPPGGWEYFGDRRALKHPLRHTSGKDLFRGSLCANIAKNYVNMQNITDSPSYHWTPEIKATVTIVTTFDSQNQSLWLKKWL